MPNIVEIIVRAVDKTKAGLTSPIKNIEDLQKSVSNLTPAFTAVGVAVAGAFAAMSKHAINVADETNKMAQRAGVTTESFSTMAYALRLAGGDAEKMAVGFKQLNKSINEAAEPGSKAADVFRQLGVSAINADGSLRKADDVLLDLAQKFSQTADGAGKVAAAQALLGKTGEEMIPFLNQGREAIASLRNEAKAFGLEIGGAAAQNAENFNDNITRLKSAVQGIAQTFVAGILPTLVQVTEAMVACAKETGFFQGLAMTLVDIFKGLVLALRLIWFGFTTLGQVIGTVASIAYDFFYGIIFNAVGILMSISDSIIAVVKGLINLGEAAGRVGEILYHFFTGNFKEAWESSKGAVEDMKNAVVQVGKDIADSWATNGKISGEVLMQSWDNIKAASKELGKDLSQDWKNFADFTTKLFSDQTIKGPKADNKPALKIIDSDAERKNAQEVEKIMAEMQNSLRAGQDRLVADENLRYQNRLAQIANLKATEEEKRVAELAAEQEHVLKLDEIRREYAKKVQDIEIELTNSALEGYAREASAVEENYRRRMEQLQQMRLDEDTYFKLSQKAYAAYMLERKQLERTILTNTSSMFGNMAEAAKAFGKKGFEAYKAFASAQALIATYSSAVSAYNAMVGIPYVGPALAVAAAAAAIAAGLANVAAIQSQQPAGVAHGGLDYVPREGTYLLDEGEAVLNKAENAARMQNQGGYGGGPTEVNVYLDGDLLGRSLIRLAKNGRLNVMLGES